jgi:hypothetical protein
MFNAVTKGEKFINRDGIKAEMSSWTFSHYHLDFETIGPPIPKFPATRPYQQVPFQYSLHVDLGDGSEPKHFEYLHQDESDPRPGIAKRLATQIGDLGSVVAYNKKFESGVLKDLAELCPDLKDKLLAVEARLVDPLPIVREHVYYKDFHGSFSIKAVAPALLGKHASYEDLEIGSGGLAPIRYLQLLKERSPKAHDELRKQLLTYCKQDTAVMLELVRWLAKD